MIVNKARLLTILDDLNNVMTELQAAATENPTNGTLKSIIYGAESVLALLRFFLATNN